MLFGFEMIFPSEYILPHQSHVVNLKNDSSCITTLNTITINSKQSKVDIANKVKEKVIISLSQVKSNNAEINANITSKSDIAVVKKEEPSLNQREITVFFEKNSAVIDDAYKKEIENINRTTLITGCASPEGSEKYNLELSKKRAQSVANLLQQDNRIDARGEECCKNIRQEDWDKCRKVQILPLVD